MTKEQIIITLAAVGTGLLVAIIVLIMIIINQNKILNVLRKERHRQVDKQNVQREKRLDASYPGGEKPKHIREIAIKNDFNFIDYQHNIGMLSFSKEDIRINIYLTKMTVVVAIRGMKQVSFERVDVDQMQEIFKNPKHLTQA